MMDRQVVISLIVMNRKHQVNTCFFVTAWWMMVQATYEHHYNPRKIVSFIREWEAFKRNMRSQLAKYGFEYYDVSTILIFLSTFASTIANTDENMSDSMIGQYCQYRCKYVELKVSSEISTIHNTIIIKYSSGSMSLDTIVNTKDRVVVSSCIVIV